VGCGSHDAPEELLRLVVAEGAVAFDLAGGAFGRGAHVHARPACLVKAPRALSRTLHAGVHVDGSELGQRLVSACSRRFEGLLLAARRLRCVHVGANASADALNMGAPLAIVATDAGVIASSTAVSRAVAEGRAVAWANKAELGRLLGAESVAVCAVAHAGIAAELKRVRAAALAGASVTGESAQCRPEAR
jgi:predicted RNA-binding protein YlxR (DUF448 family)/ribosomal protein L7Ae-like RNA K-turn-binding protein